MPDNLRHLAAELLILERQRLAGQGLTTEQGAQRQRLLAEVLEQLRRSDERRRYVRVSAALEVRFRVGEATITSAASEMSYGGLSLSSNLWVIADQRMQIETLRIGDRAFPLRVRCRVVWKISQADGQPRAGLQFIDLTDEGRLQVRTIFEQLFVSYLERLSF